VPRLALPFIRPRICFRHLTRFGINIIAPQITSAVAA